LGDDAVNSKTKGYFIEPTIFTDVKPDMKIMKEEIFRPVDSTARFKDEEEVIELANDTTYGLAAGIFTKTYERAVRVTGALKAGTVRIPMGNRDPMSETSADPHTHRYYTWVNLFNFVNWLYVLFQRLLFIDT
jgi:aldehyde dehydrogenase (NAD+)